MIFPYGKVTLDEVLMDSYEADTSAVAVVLQEFGHARLNSDVKVYFEYHTKIKILKKEGLEQGNFRIELHKEGNLADNMERLVTVKASTFNLDNNSLKETEFPAKKVMLENTHKYMNVAKFAMPDVRVGSVIEVSYVTESPYYFQFHNWEFQGEIPKMWSEFWADIPANFSYNIILRGATKLKVNKMEVLPSCFSFPGSSGKSDCTRSKYAQEKLPAFIEEDYMTSRKNFLGAIYYELSEVVDAYGAKHKYAEDWDDMVLKMNEHDYFGKIIKKASKMMEAKIPSIVQGVTDTEAKYKNVFGFIQSRYSWNGELEKYTREDPKKTFESRIGSSADYQPGIDRRAASRQTRC